MDGATHFLNQSDTARRASALDRDHILGDVSNEPDAGIKALFDNVDESPFSNDVKLDLRVPRLKRRYDLAQENANALFRRIDADAACRLVSKFIHFAQRRVFVTTLGHNGEMYRDPQYLSHLLGGIYWSATGLGQRR